jgi:3-oxoacyl-[acyl-carrier-protein] synthase II
MRVVEAPIVTHPHGQPSVGLPPRRDASPRVALRSWGLTCPLGEDVASAWDALLAGRFITDHAKSDRRALELARSVAAPLLKAGIHPGAALVVGTSKGSVENWLDASGDIERRVHGLADVAAAIAREWNLRGPRLTVSAACASGLHALIRAAMMIRTGEVRRALVVATEASVHPLFLGSFQRLGVLAKAGAGCRPFDRNRDGFVMSEAAAAVLLEAADPDESPRTAVHGSSPAPQIFLDRFALAGDATHLTGGDPGARTLRYLLDRVIDGRPVDLVHAHGTGTPLNDEAELAAIEAAVATVPDATPPAVYSHKGALGHSLGAAGLFRSC